MNKLIKTLQSCRNLFELPEEQKLSSFHVIAYSEWHYETFQRYNWRTVLSDF